MRRIRRHLTFANVASAIALFVAISGGTAFALSGSNTVFTDDIANDTQPASGGNPAGGLVAPDLRAGSVGTSEAVNNSLTGTDILESSLGKVGDANTLDGKDSTAFGASALTGRVDLLTPGISVPPTVYGAPNGTSTPSTSESDVTHLSPNATIVARDLVVTASVEFNPEPGDATFTLRDDGADTAVSCTVSSSSPANRCNSGGATATISPGSRLSLQISATGGTVVNAAGVEFGWRATTP